MVGPLQPWRRIWNDPNCERTANTSEGIDWDVVRWLGQNWPLRCEGIWNSIRFVVLRLYGLEHREVGCSDSDVQRFGI